MNDKSSPPRHQMMYTSPRATGLTEGCGIFIITQIGLGVFFVVNFFMSEILDTPFWPSMAALGAGIIAVAWLSQPHQKSPHRAARDRLTITTPGDSAAKKNSHGIDVSFDKEQTYHIRGRGASEGRAHLDLAGVYMLRYWLPEKTQLSINLYNLHNQHEQDLLANIAGTGATTFRLDDSRYEITVQVQITSQCIDTWLIELEPLYDHALTEEFSQQIDEAEGEISASQGFTH